jgi:aspartyl-tRNA(Asn)/glutamyl-tRNA(Gln) amidotransferase subunit A
MIEELAAALRARKVSARELARDALRRAAESQPRLNAFVTLAEDQAMARAAELDAMLERRQDLGPLHGIPIAHKDCFRTAGVRTTNGSKLLADYLPARDADVVARLNAAGAVSIGKTGLHEFTYGITSVNPHYGAVRNPWDESRVSGGSSGGSGAAVAAGVVALATGTDTGGSIRVPASFCGCVGLKPTYGALSRRGVFPLGPSQDHVGPLTRTVRDAEIAFFAMGGTLRLRPAQTLRAGVPADYFFDRLEPDVGASVRNAAQVAATVGLKVGEVRLPDVEELMEIARTTLLSEAAAVLGRFSTRREDFGEDVWALLEKGRAIAAHVYLEAQRRRRRLAREFARVWEQCDCLLTPTTPLVAFPIEHRQVTIGGVPEDPRTATTRCTRPFNVLGWPALSLPCGWSRQGLPVGLQVIAAPGREDAVFRVAGELERALDVSARPPLTACTRRS